MKSKNLFTHVFTILLIFILISAVATSCQIAGPGDRDVSETEEAGDVNETDNQQQEEIGEEPEDEEEITTVNLWISDLIPEYISAEVRNKLRKVFDEIIIADEKENSDVWVEIDISSKESEIRWVLVPVVSFYTYNDNIYIDDLKAFWEGEENSLDYINNDNLKPVFVVLEDVFNVLEKVWGSFKNKNIKIV
ncbi:MAG: hypothetical protein MUO96_05845, partial [Actinobacteria bacterium]|nr:hypothetical protein [Actinomycetota bacterium]